MPSHLPGNISKDHKRIPKKRYDCARATAKNQEKSLHSPERKSPSSFEPKMVHLDNYFPSGHRGIHDRPKLFRLLAGHDRRPEQHKLRSRYRAYLHGFSAPHTPPLSSHPDINRRVSAIHRSARVRGQKLSTASRLWTTSVHSQRKSQALSLIRQETAAPESGKAQQARQSRKRK